MGGSLYAVALEDGSMYGLLGDGWLAMPPEGIPKARWPHTAVWTGSRMIIWGGTSPNCGSEGGVCSDGAAYAPATDTWAPLRTEGAPSARSEHVGLWTGNALFIWGGMGGGGSHAPPFGWCFVGPVSGWVLPTTKAPHA
ncbi:hypothetical protein D7Y21_14610 [Corallococcus sp. AB045]|uniref:hypothetical protein n=1 Tax=Corallococcus sp. AB045 TaxID=2316719 RepID=UPI000EBA147B|nr:hypothetical protein [Corallococcus sp. AB045]RKH88461.1 hypothetical protein D7Y21_14610 [Corallococcus sp. AB045]